MIVLAGGVGRRMGGPKALLEAGGTTMLELAVARFAAGGAEVLVAGPSDMELPAGPARRVFDRAPGLGPLAGLEAGLAAMSSPVAVAVGVDMPYFGLADAARLAEAVAGYQAAVPRVEGRVHATSAAYAVSALAAVSAALDTGDLRLRAALDRLHVHWLEDFDRRPLTNLNHPDEFRRFLDESANMDPVNDFLVELGDRLAAAAGRRGLPLEAPRLDGPMAAELLDLARVVAHSEERRFAPLASYLAGIAVGRLGDLDPALLAEIVAEVRRDLEPAPPTA